MLYQRVFINEFNLCNALQKYEINFGKKKCSYSANCTLHLQLIVVFVEEMIFEEMVRWQ